MNRLKAFVVTLLAVASLTAQTSRGTVPRPDAGGYATHAEQDGVQIGASALTSEEVKKAFVTDLNQCCLVVEVAFYPAKKDFVKIDLDNFMLREAGKEIGEKVSTADVLAARLEVRPQPRDREHTPGVSSTSEVGYERQSGIDPRTGQPGRSGVYQRESVGVGVPIGGGKTEGPATLESSRKAIEAELKAKMLPEMSAWEPVAGYLYFSVPKKSKSGYELVYTLNGKKIVLALK